MADEASIEGTNLPQDSGESSQSTVEINIKTLDSQHFTFRVGKDMPVPVLKEKVANASGVPVERQRLIYRGRVLKDDHLLSEYNLEDGHTLHLVARQPVQEQPSSGAGNDSNAAPRNRMGTVAHSVVLGTVNLADQGGNAAVDISRIVGSVLNSLGVGSLAPGGTASDMLSTTGSNQVPSGVEREGSQTATSRTVSGSPSTFTSFNHAFQSLHQNSQFAATGAPSQNMVIPDSLTTLSEFISRMELALQNVGSMPPQSGNSSDPPRSQIPSADRRGLPTPETLGSVMEQVQQLLGHNVTTALTHLATGLLRERTLTDPVERDRIQAEAMHVGAAMQHLGVMLLELSRTIMTLRMGQSPGESALNAGPAVYISPTGPNPIMVQPFTSQLNSFFGGLSPPLVRGASTAVPAGDPSRNINIHIHAGSSVSPGGSFSATRASSTDAVLGERPLAEQASSGGNGSADSASIGGFPSRTVVAAIPARGTAETGRVINIMYPVHMSTQVSMPHSASARRPHPDLSSGTQPNTTIPVPQPSLEPTAISSLLAQINAQIGSAPAQNVQGSNASNNDQSTDTQLNSTAGSEVQNDMTSILSQPSTQTNSQIASGNAQGQSSAANCFESSCRREGSQLVSPEISSHLGEDDIYSQARHEVVDDDIGGIASVKSSVIDARMPGIGQKPEQERVHCSVIVDSRESSVTRDNSLITTSTEPTAVCEPSDIVSNRSASNDLGKNSSAEMIHASSSSHGYGNERPAPLGLGLGGLQPKKRLKHPKSVGKDQMPCEKSSTSQNQQSVARGQQFLNSLLSQSSEVNRVNANGNPLLSVISQIKDSLPVDREGGSGQVDASDMMSSILQSPVFNNILTGVSAQTGAGSSTDLRNMLDQVIRSPALRNTMNEIVQQVEGHSQDTWAVRGEGGLDFSRIIQQIMPAVSQAVGRASAQPAAIPSFQPEQHLQCNEDTGRDAVLHGRKSKVNLLQAVERIRQFDVSGDIFRAVLENASHLHNEGNNSDLVNNLADNEELTNEFCSMLVRDLQRRLHREHPSAD